MMAAYCIEPRDVKMSSPSDFSRGPTGARGALAAFVKAYAASELLPPRPALCRQSTGSVPGFESVLYALQGAALSPRTVDQRAIDRFALREPWHRCPWVSPLRRRPDGRRSAARPTAHRHSSTAHSRSRHAVVHVGDAAPHPVERGRVHRLPARPRVRHRLRRSHGCPEDGARGQRRPGACVCDLPGQTKKRPVQAASSAPHTLHSAARALDLEE